MALADLLLGAFALPLYIDVSINNGYQFSLKIVNSTLARVYGLSYGISRWVSLTSAVSISCERFYAVYWPFKHRTLTARTYHVALFVLWHFVFWKPLPLFIYDHTTISSVMLVHHTVSLQEVLLAEATSPFGESSATETSLHNRKKGTRKTFVWRRL